MHRLSRTWIVTIAATALCATASCERPAGDAQGDWSSYGRTASEDRFSPLEQINAGNVGRLAPAWYYEVDTDRGQEATPIATGGRIYVSTAWSKVYAFDAKTGERAWEFDPEVPRNTLFKGCCDAVNRGVAVHDGKVFVGTLDGRLVAIDARTGKQLWTTVTVDQSKPYTITGAPRVFKNLVLIGNAGAEYGVRGYISAYDPNNGKLVWRFYTVPNPDGKPDGQPSDAVLKQKAAPTWHDGVWKKSGGGGTVWDAIAYDPEADLLYFGVGNGSPWNYYERSGGKGDNLFLSSIVAVRPSTGQYVWHYQTTPGEAWDYTATQQMILADLEIGGKTRKVLMQAPKNGFFYVLDRLTGKLISGKPYAQVNWATGIDTRTGRPLVVDGARYGDKPAVISPPSLGAHSWHPMAYSPQTKLVYIPVQGQPGMTYAREKPFKMLDGHPNYGIVSTSPSDPPNDPKTMAMIRSMFHGELVAWDPVAQKVRWRVKHPFFANGGVLATGGGLVFQGDAEGQFSAYDAASGKKVWSYRMQNGIVAGPISYAVGGKQYVAIMVGYGGIAALLGSPVSPDRPRLPGRLVVFSLDGQAKIPAQTLPEPMEPDLTQLSSTGNVDNGRRIFGENCSVCHGGSASGRFTADLRRSPILASDTAWRSVVIDGALQDQGMVSFSKYLTPKEAEDVRAYVILQTKRMTN